MPDGTAQTLGVVRAMTDPDNVAAEFAIIVSSDLKRRGLGHLLMCKMIGFLTQQDIRRIVGYVMRENHSMREMARLLGFKVDLATSDADTLTLVLTLTHRSPPCVPVKP